MIRGFGWDGSCGGLRVGVKLTRRNARPRPSAERMFRKLTGVFLMGFRVETREPMSSEVVDLEESMAGLCVSSLARD